MAERGWKLATSASVTSSHSAELRSSRPRSSGRRRPDPRGRLDNARRPAQPTRPRPASRARRTKRLGRHARVEEVRVPDHPRERPQVPFVGVGELRDRGRAVREDDEFRASGAREGSQAGEVDEGPDADHGATPTKLNDPPSRAATPSVPCCSNVSRALRARSALRAARVECGPVHDHDRVVVDGESPAADAVGRGDRRRGPRARYAARVPCAHRRAVGWRSTASGRAGHESLDGGRATRDDDEVNQPPAPIPSRSPEGQSTFGG